ncbi:MAG: flagellar basal body L-ring protein FlgH [Pirellulales bacterium]|nr:flagellar basal body L-ring protein FlgH [Pirellulales bacterium]
MKITGFWFKTVALAALTVLSMSEIAAAQSSSIYGPPDMRRAPLTLSNSSWTYQAPPEPKEIKTHDLVTVIVNYKSQVISEGETDRKKKASFKAKLKDWVLLRNFSLIPDPQSAGDPSVDAQWDNKMKSEGSLESRDAMEFKIACTVVDIRPNGVLVLEGHRTIRNNNETWDLSLTGLVRPKDVLDNNTILSENVADLKIFKREEGSVRDSYRRGWLMKWIDTYQLF